MNEANKQLKQLIYEFKSCFSTHISAQRIETVEVLYPVLLRYVRRDFSNLDIILDALIIETLSSSSWEALRIDPSSSETTQHDIIHTISLLLFNLSSGISTTSTLVESPHIARLRYIVTYLLKQLNGVLLETINEEGQRFIELVLTTLSMMCYPGHKDEIAAILGVFLSESPEYERNDTVVKIFHELCILNDTRSLSRSLKENTEALQQFLDSLDITRAYYTLCSTLLSIGADITAKPTTSLEYLLILGEHVDTATLAAAISVNNLTPATLLYLSERRLTDNAALASTLISYVMTADLELGYLTCAFKLIASLSTQIPQDLIDKFDEPGYDIALSQLVKRYSEDQLNTRYLKLRDDALAHAYELGNILIYRPADIEDCTKFPLFISDFSYKLLQGLGSETTQLIQILNSDQKPFIDQQINLIISKIKTLSEREQQILAVAAFSMSSSPFLPLRNAGVRLALNMGTPHSVNWINTTISRVLDATTDCQLYPVLNIESLPDTSLTARFMEVLNENDQKLLPVSLKRQEASKKKFAQLQNSYSKEMNKQLWNVVDPLISWASFLSFSHDFTFTGPQVLFGVVDELKKDTDPIYAIEFAHKAIVASGLETTLSSANMLAHWADAIIRTDSVEANEEAPLSGYLKTLGIMAVPNNLRAVHLKTSLWEILSILGSGNFRHLPNAVAEILMEDLQSNYYSRHNASLKALINFPIFSRKTAEVKHDESSHFIFNRQFFSYGVRTDLRKAFGKLIDKDTTSAFFNSIVIGEEAPDAANESEFPVYFPPEGVDCERIYHLLSFILIGRLRQGKSQNEIIRWLASTNAKLIVFIIETLVSSYHKDLEYRRKLPILQLCNNFVTQLSLFTESSANIIAPLAIDGLTSGISNLRVAAYDLAISLVENFSETSVIDVALSLNTPLAESLLQHHTNGASPSRFFKLLHAVLTLSSHPKQIEILEASFQLLSMEDLNIEVASLVYSMIEFALSHSILTPDHINTIVDLTLSRLAFANKLERLKIMQFIERLPTDSIKDATKIVSIMSGIIAKSKEDHLKQPISILTRYIGSSSQEVTDLSIAAIARKLNISTWDVNLINTLRQVHTASATFKPIFSYLDRIIVHESQLVLNSAPIIIEALEEFTSLPIIDIETDTPVWEFWRLIFVQVIRLLSSEVRLIASKALSTLKSCQPSLSVQKYLFNAYRLVLTSGTPQAARYAMLLISNTSSDVAPYLEPYRSFIEKMTELVYQDHKIAFEELYETGVSLEMLPLFIDISIFIIKEARSDLWVPYVDHINKLIPGIAQVADFCTYKSYITKMAALLKGDGKAQKASTRILAALCQELYNFDNVDSLLQFVDETLGKHIKPGCHPALVKAVCSVYSISPAAQTMIFELIHRMIEGCKKAEVEDRKTACASLICVLEALQFKKYISYTVKNLMLLNDTFYPFAAMKFVRNVLESYDLYLRNNEITDYDRFTDIFSLLQKTLFSIAFGELAGKRANLEFQKKAPEIVKKNELEVIKLVSKYSTIESIKLFVQAILDLLTGTDNSATIAAINGYFTTMVEGIRLNTSISLADLYDWYLALVPEVQETVAIKDNTQSKLRRGDESLLIGKARRLAADHAFSAIVDDFTGYKLNNAVTTFILSAMARTANTRKDEDSPTAEILTLAITHFGDNNSDISVAALSLLMSLNQDILVEQSPTLIDICINKLSSHTVRKSHSQTILSTLDRALHCILNSKSFAISSVKSAQSLLDSLLTIYNEQATEQEVNACLQCLNRCYNLFDQRRLCEDGEKPLKARFMNFYETILTTFIVTPYRNVRAKSSAYLSEFLRREKLAPKFREEQFNIIVKAAAGDNQLAKINSLALLADLFKVLSLESTLKAICDSLSSVIPVFWSKDPTLDQKVTFCNIILLCEQDFFLALLNNVYAVSSNLSVIAHCSVFIHDYVSMISEAKIPLSLAVGAFTVIQSHLEKGLLRISSLRYTDVCLAAACIPFISDLTPYSNVLTELIDVSSFKAIVDQKPDYKLRIATCELFGRYLEKGLYEFVSYRVLRNYFSNIHLITSFDAAQKLTMDQLIDTAFNRPETFDPHNEEVSADIFTGYALGPITSCLKERACPDTDVLVTILLYFTITAVKKLPESFNEYTLMKIMEPVIRLDNQKCAFKLSTEVQRKISNVRHAVEKMIKGNGHEDILEKVIADIDNRILQLSYDKTTRKIAERLNNTE